MRKRNLLFIVLFLICYMASTASAEDFKSAYKLLQPVFEVENPWEISIDQISAYSKTMAGFTCDTRRNDNADLYIKCSSQSNKYNNFYKILFDFGQDKFLNAIELQISGKDVDAFLQNPTYDPEMIITMIKDKILREDYIETTEAIVNVKDKFNHIYHNKNTIPVLNLRFNSNCILSSGYIVKTRPSEDNAIVLAFSDVNYFIIKQYVEETNPATGETSIGIIGIGN